MQQKKELYKVIGMNKDMSYSLFDKKYCIDAKNIRITNSGENSTLSISNEKGTLDAVYSEEIIGTCVASDKVGERLVLITTNTINGVQTDRIYVVSSSGQNNINVSNIFAGTLNIQPGAKIQTLPIYENDLIQKVYWVDQNNQPRVINILKSYLDSADGNQFNFSSDIVGDDESSLSVSKIEYGGVFKAGTIQYAVSYFNLNGKETSIVHLSDIFNISPLDRAGKADEVVNNSFNINLSNINGKYDYVRIYSIHRTSKDQRPEVKIISDIKTIDNSISIIDTGNIGYVVDSDILLYIGSEAIIAKTIAQKSNTLFLGNISLIDRIYPGTSLTVDGFEWYYGDDINIESLSSGNGMYPYDPKSLNFNEFDIKHFKFNEIYRFGIQGQYKNGKWSQPIYIGSDKTVDKRYWCSYINDAGVYIKPVYGKITIGSELSSELSELGFINIRPVMVVPTIFDKRSVAQCVATNTLSVLKNRHSDNIQSKSFSMPDYLTRFNRDIYNGKFLKFNAPFDVVALNEYHLKGFFQDELEIMSAAPNSNPWYTYAPYDGYNGPEYTNSSDFNIYTSQFDTDPLNKSNIWFIDTNIINLFSPEFDYGLDNILNSIKIANKISLYGVAHCTGYSYNLDYDYAVTPGFESKSNKSTISNYGFSNQSFYKSFMKNNNGLFDNNVSSSDNYKKCNTQIPMWSPSKLSLPKSTEKPNGEDSGNYSIDVDFTKIDRYNINYFGFNNILKNNKSVVYNINKPSVSYDDSYVYLKSSNNDNTGNVLYRGSVDEVYPALSYWNSVEESEQRVLQSYNWWYKRKCNSSMFVRYKTTPHCVVSLSDNVDGNSMLLPKVDFTAIGAITSSTNTTVPFWRESGGYSVDTITGDYFNNDIILPNPSDPEWGQLLSNNNLLIFDIIKDINEDSIYGGNSESAIINNKWISCGDGIELIPGVINYLYATKGDTYIRRFDTLRVYPEDENQIPAHKEAMSFICESLINTDGRSDQNRKSSNINLMSKDNYGLINNAYSQLDNYFVYNQVDYDSFKLDKFNNLILFSKTKSLGETVDSWTNITMLNSFDANGLYGNLSSINLLGNELFAFQDYGISRILFNERVQSLASDGISLELSNGYKSPEIRYITNQYGCDDLNSIQRSKSGLYFIDYKNKSLCRINSESISDISLENGFKNWFKDKLNSNRFNLSYDDVNNELYIHNNNYCLNFSENLGSFQSFYDYLGVHKMYNIWDKFISIRTQPGSTNTYTKLWFNWDGDYNKFFGTIKQFYVEYLVAPDPQYDKIFNIAEYRTNNSNINFNQIYATNNHQSAISVGSDYASRSRMKFNVNRVIIPRDTQTMNRIRSTWVKLKFGWYNAQNNNNKFSMEDLDVMYNI